MVTDKDILYFTFEGDRYLRIREMAKKAEIGGNSEVRTRDERMRKLAEDQVIGQCGEAALSMYVTGSLDKYLERREEINKNPYVGDNGFDFPFLRVDVKSSRRHDSLSLTSHNLILRPKEIKPDITYIQALVKNTGFSAIVYFIGWATSGMLPKTMREEGIFAGAYVLPCHDLNPLPPLNWVF